MADDIVTRLRESFDKKLGDFRDLLEAANEIERLRDLLKVANSQLRAHQMLNKERSYRGRD